MNSAALNAHQRRHIEVVLSMLEAEMNEVERIALGGRTGPDTLTQVDHDLPADFAERMPPHVDAIRARVRELTHALSLSARRAPNRRTIHATLTAAIIRLDDSSAAELRGYGRVEPRYATEVWPVLSDIRASLMAIDQLLAEDPSALAPLSPG